MTEMLFQWWLAAQLIGMALGVVLFFAIVVWVIWTTIRD